jgi:hypothetical protein
METYTPPTITELGSLHELTLSSPINKIGRSSDQLTAIIPNLVGDQVTAVS